MKPGDIVLLRFPQADLSAGKLRPALVVAIAPGRHLDVLLSLITSRAYQEIPDFDEAISPAEADFTSSGLKARSIIRLARLVSVDMAVINARLGDISPERLRRVKGVWQTGSSSKQVPSLFLMWINAHILFYVIARRRSSVEAISCCGIRGDKSPAQYMEVGWKALH